MSVKLRIWFLALTTISINAAGATTAPNAPTSVAPDTTAVEARSLSKKEVVALYDGKSWMWPDGAAYFSPNGKFIAIAGIGKNRSNIKGKWNAYQNGQMCFSGTWKAKVGRRYDKTCFAHKMAAGNIYQQRLPKGDWYVFRHNPEAVGDQRLVAGDQTLAQNL